MKRTRIRRRPANTMPDAETTALLIARAQGRCEICNVDLNRRDWSRHHRLPRGRGGTNVLSNLMLLCGSGTTGCHGVIESHRAIAYDRGWLVRTGMTPAEVPVILHASIIGVLDDRLFLLTDDGTYDEVTA